MGGDRDGHPFVTPEITKETIRSLRSSLIRLYERDVENLYDILSSSEQVVPVSSSLSNWIGRNKHILQASGNSVRVESSEAYRLALRILFAKLGFTKRTGRIRSQQRICRRPQPHPGKSFQKHGCKRFRNVHYTADSEGSCIPLFFCTA